MSNRHQWDVQRNYSSRNSSLTHRPDAMLTRAKLAGLNQLWWYSGVTLKLCCKKKFAPSSREEKGLLFLTDLPGVLHIQEFTSGSII